jgi:hypothetical protein
MLDQGIVDRVKNSSKLFNQVEKVVEAYITPYLQGSHNIQQPAVADSSNLGKDVVRYVGFSKYRVHIPELMPTVDFTEGIWCDNAMITSEVTQCPSGQIGSAVGGSVGGSLGGSIAGPVGSQVGSQIGSQAGGGQKMYKFNYADLPINTKVIIRFMDNDINTAHVIGILPWTPSDSNNQFIT